MKKRDPIREELTDSFLKECVEILDLSPEFRFTSTTLATKVTLNEEKIKKLQGICKKNQMQRRMHNFKIKGRRLNENWCYEVLSKYFEINLNK